MGVVEERNTAENVDSLGAAKTLTQTAGSEKLALLAPFLLPLPMYYNYLQIQDFTLPVAAFNNSPLTNYFDVQKFE